MKTGILIFLCILLCASSAFSQQYALDKGSLMLSGTGSFSSLGGDLYASGDNDRQNFITLSSAINYFIIPHLFVGGSVGYTRWAQGDQSISSITIGPNLGYAFGSSERKLYPFLGTGFRYNSGKNKGLSSSGTDFVIGGGLVILGSKNVGLVLEANYHALASKPEGASKSESSDVLSVGVGIAGFLY